MSSDYPLPHSPGSSFSFSRVLTLAIMLGDVRFFLKNRWFS